MKTAQGLFFYVLKGLFKVRRKNERYQSSLVMYDYIKISLTYLITLSILKT